LFADISGFTILSQKQSSEAMFQLVQDCFKELVSIVADYEGRISGFRGDGLLALFGAPILHENDAERAILVAMDMRNIMHERGLEVSIGINTAMMTVGEIQTQLHSEYTAYGTDVNLAKRLQESANPGQILVGAGSHRLTRRAFDFDIISDLTMKGFTQPVTAYSVKQVKVHPEKLRGIEGLRARMIGREHEFTEIKESVDQWLSGYGQIVSVIGEAGIGKSRLVTELKTYIADKGDTLRYLEGRCVSIGQPISYWPFIDILRTYFNLKEEDAPSTIAQKVIDGTKHVFPNTADETLPLVGKLLSVRFGNELDDRLKFATPEQIRHQTMMQLRDFFRELANKQPLLLILEDLHWSDELSIDLVTYLMDELTHAPLMLLCVYRPEKEQKVWKLSEQAQRKCLDRYTEIMLKRLSSHDGRLLVEELLTIDDLPDSVKNTILEKSEGNPFFIEEVIRSLMEQDMVYRDSDRWRARTEIVNINVPDTIQSVLLSRVDRLQVEARYVLQCASVIGRLFKYSLLDHLTSQERNLNRYLSEFEDRELVYEERRIPELEYAFKHALTQEATYQGILERKKKEFHLHVAQGIERLYQERIEEYYEELAHHYSKSDNIEKAVEYHLKAGNKAKVNYANEIAISHFQKVLELLEQFRIEQNDWKLEALKALGEIYVGIGRLTEAESSFRSAIELAEDMKLDRHLIIRLYDCLTESFFWQGKYDDIIPYAKRGLELLKDDPECIESALMNAMMALANIKKENYNKFKEYTSRNMKFIKKLPYIPQLRGAYLHIVTLFMYKNDITAWNWSKELENLALSHGDLNAVAEVKFRQCMIVLRKGDGKTASLLIRESLDICEKIENKKFAEWCRGYLAPILFSTGYITEAEANAKMDIEPEVAGMPRDIDIASAHSFLATIFLSQRNFDEAIQHYQKALDIRKTMANPVMQAWAEYNLGRAYLKKGDYDQASQLFNEFAGKVFEFQDKYAQYRLFYLMEGFEALYKAKGDRDGFINFCHSFRQTHADEIEKLTLPQLYLESTQISNDLSNLAFADDFDKEEMDSSWSWIDEFNDCHYKVVENGLEIHAVNGRDLSGQNMSAPRLIREVSSNFAVQVCISPATKEKPQLGGLFVWKDDKNYICFQRGDSDPDGFQFYGYINKEQLMAGRGFLPEESDATYIRLERIGDELSAYCSIDGENWLTCGKLKMQIDDPLQVGIYAHGMIDRTVYCGEYKEGTATLFRNFRIWTR
jgi:class 3 adenylate cyclase/tetratricopeptide (TPR) repeat protein